MIPKWARVVLRTVGVVNVALVLLGASFLVDSVRFFLIKYTPDPSIPYFRPAFVSMTLVNIAFLAILLATAVQFIRTRISAINLYSLIVLAEFLYAVTTGILWRAQRGIGLSVGAATGVGNMGIAPFEFCFLVPFLYPVASLILLQVIRQRHSSRQPRVDNALQVLSGNPVLSTLTPSSRKS